MKNFMKTAFAIGCLIAIVGCGKKDEPAAQAAANQANGGCPAGQSFYNNTCVPNANVQGYNNQCPVGNTFYNGSCQPQGPCQVGQAYVNNQCVQGNANPGNNPVQYGPCQPGTFQTQVGCLPQGGCMSGYAAKTDVQPNQCWPIISNGYNQYNNQYQYQVGYPMNYYNYGYNYGGNYYYYFHW